MNSGARILADASQRVGNVMARMTVGMVQMSPRKNVMSGLVSPTSSAAGTTAVFQAAGNVTMTTTVGITRMRRPVSPGLALKVSSLAPMAVALQAVGSVMGTMIVLMALMRKNASHAVNKTSSTARVATASHCDGVVMLMLIAWMAVMRKTVARECGLALLMSSSVTTLCASHWPGNVMVRMTVVTILMKIPKNA